MKLDYPKEWFERHIERDGDVEVGAGLPPAHHTATESPGPEIKPLDTRIAFGQFVRLWRRNQGWNVEKLATEAGIEAEEVIEIERDPSCEPEPDAVYRLATLFGVPSQRLLELAGLTESRTPHLREQAIRFTAWPEPTPALSEVERQAFEVFVTALTSEPKA